MGIIDSSTYLAEHLAEVPVHVIPIALDRLPPDVPAGHDGRVLRLDPAGGVVVPARGPLPRASGRPGPRCTWPTRARSASCSASPTRSSQVALLPVAYYTGDDFKPGNRRPAEEVTYWNGWRRSG